MTPEGPIVWANEAYAQTGVEPYVHERGQRACRRSAGSIGSGRTSRTARPRPGRRARACALSSGGFLHVAPPETRAAAGPRRSGGAARLPRSAVTHRERAGYPTILLASGTGAAGGPPQQHDRTVSSGGMPWTERCRSERSSSPHWPCTPRPRRAPSRTPSCTARPEPPRRWACSARPSGSARSNASRARARGRTRSPIARPATTPARRPSASTRPARRRHRVR